MFWIYGDWVHTTVSTYVREYLRWDNALCDTMRTSIIIVLDVDLSGYCRHDNVIMHILIARLILYRYYLVLISDQFRVTVGIQ